VETAPSAEEPVPDNEDLPKTTAGDSGGGQLARMLDEHTERRRKKRLQELLARRQRLAQAAVEHVSHQLPGAGALWAALDDVEETIREEDRATWVRLYPEWAAHDTESLHLPEDPQPDSCRLCVKPERPQQRPEPRRPLVA
jgi:hypothetical protein